MFDFVEAFSEVGHFQQELQRLSQRFEQMPESLERFQEARKLIGFGH